MKHEAFLTPKKSGNEKIEKNISIQGGEKQKQEWGVLTDKMGVTRPTRVARPTRPTRALRKPLYN